MILSNKRDQFPQSSCRFRFRYNFAIESSFFREREYTLSSPLKLWSGNLFVRHRKVKMHELNAYIHAQKKRGDENQALQITAFPDLNFCAKVKPVIFLGFTPCAYSICVNKQTSVWGQFDNVIRIEVQFNNCPSFSYQWGRRSDCMHLKGNLTVGHIHLCTS